LDRVLAVLPPAKNGTLSDALARKIRERERARRDKNFELADRIRRELAEAGVLLEDTKDGVRWKILEKRG